MLRASGAAAEIVSVDSMAVYRGMDIGTAKPTSTERAEFPHHLIDLVDPDQEFSVAAFQRAAESVLAVMSSRDATAILVGGTGLYLDAVVDGFTLPGRYPDARATVEGRPSAALHAELTRLDPLAASRIEPSNDRRLVRALEVTIGSGRRFSSFGPGLQGARTRSARFYLAGLRVPRPFLADRIAIRYGAQLAAGFVEEVRSLHERFGPSMSRTAAQALGYRELIAHVRGESSLEEAVAVAVTRTVAFAKRQERWFRRDDRIHWYEPEPAADPLRYGDNLVRLVEPLLADWSKCLP